MNFEFKENFFRFIFPATLFWSLFVLFNPTEFNDVIGKYNHPVFIGTIIFVFTAFLLNTTGSFFMIPVIKCKLPRLDIPQEELNYWGRIGKSVNKYNSNFLEKKIDRRWDFLVAYFNSTLAVIFFNLFQISITKNFDSEILLTSLVLLIIFIVLICRGLKYIIHYTEVQEF